MSNPSPVPEVLADPFAVVKGPPPPPQAPIARYTLAEFEKTQGPTAPGDRFEFRNGLRTVARFVVAWTVWIQGHPRDVRREVYVESGKTVAIPRALAHSVWQLGAANVITGGSWPSAELTNPEQVGITQIPMLHDVLEAGVSHLRIKTPGGAK